MSFYTALTGLNGAQTELSTIANNIANASTNGFKKSRVAFGDIIASTPLQDPARVIGSGTAVRGVTQLMTQGAIATSDSSLDMAISGQGFFTVKSANGGAQTSFTRNGAFAVDADRFVIDGDGRRLQVFPTTADGSITSTALTSTTSLQLPLTSGAPRATTAIKLAVNLPASAAVTTAPFAPANAATYASSTSLTLYDSLGNPLAATVYYTKTATPTVADPLHHWTAHVVVGTTELTSGGIAGVPMSFDSTGAMTSPAGPAAFDAFTPASGGAAIALSFDPGVATTQKSGGFTIVASAQDGFATGKLQSVAVDKSGMVQASFTNGEVQVLGKVAVVMFSDPEGLKQTGDASYVTTPESGPPISGEAGQNGLGTILSGSLERSNVDLTDELVGLITAQRSFQANAKTIETASSLLTTIIQIH
nr:flagellar hook protein FlgE [Polymorphobacter sp.]